MIRPLLFLVGYHLLSVSDAQSASFVNLCAAAGIVYHNAGVRVEGEQRRYVFRLSPAAAFRATTLCESRGIEVKTDSRHGLPTVCRGLFARPGIILGACMFFLLIGLSGRVIWDIRIEGNTHVSEEKIEALLAESGMSVGSRCDGLDIDAIQNHVLILSDEISWISVNVTGTVADVEVREVSPAPEKQEIASSNLVATRNGTVIAFEGVRGNIAVELGEAVSGGQLLVGGVYGSEDTATRFVRSSGSIIALCEREYHVEVPLDFEKKVYTGRQKTKKSLIFFDKEVKFFINSGNSYTTCDTINRVEYFNLFGLGELPIGIRTVRYIEYETQTARRSEQTASEQASYLLWQSFADDAPEAQLVGKTVYGRTEGESYVLDALLQTHEDIAKEVPIEIRITG